MYKTSLLTDLSTSATQIIVEYDKVYNSGSGKLVKKLSKVKLSLKNLKSH